jgi:hypothetical protein
MEKIGFFYAALFFFLTFSSLSWSKSQMTQIAKERLKRKKMDDDKKLFFPS